MVLHRIWPKVPFTQRLWEPKVPRTALGACLLGLQKEYGEHPTDESQVGPSTWWPTAFPSPIRDTMRSRPGARFALMQRGGLDSRIGT